MGGPILILDDDVHFCEVLRPSLERRGYRVLTAHRARDATRLLAEDPPVAAIVDGLLPDRSGIDWIRDLRGAGNALPVAFVSAFWRDLRSYKLLTQELGVPLVLYKPVDPERLAQQLELLIGAAGGKAPVALKSDSPGPPAELLHAYRRELPGAVEQLVEAVSRVIDDPQDAAALDDLRQRAHRLRGTSATYGLAEVGEAAGRIEDVVLDSAAEDGFFEPSEEGEPDLPRELLSPRMLVVDDDPSFLDFVAEVGRAELAEVRTAQDGETAAACLDGQAMDAACVSVPLGDPDCSSDVIRQLSKRCPVVAVCIDDAMPARLDALRSGAVRVLSHPVDAELLIRVGRELVAESDVRHRPVVVCTRSEGLRRAIVDSLAPGGWHVVATGDPAYALMQLARCPAGFIVEAGARLGEGQLPSEALGQLLRASAGGRVPALIMVGGDRREEADADAAVPRSSSARWVPALEAACRARLVAGAGEGRDPLTSLRGRSETLADLRGRLSDATRHVRPLTVALLRIDDLATINDQHGRELGDRVLLRLAQMLSGRFRREDVRGRIGRADFLMTFVGVRPADVGPVLERAQREFAAVPFPGRDGEAVHVWFRAGVAGFPDAGTDAHSVLAVAAARLGAADDGEDGPVVWAGGAS